MLFGWSVVISSPDARIVDDMTTDRPKTITNTFTILTCDDDDDDDNDNDDNDDDHDIACRELFSSLSSSSSSSSLCLLLRRSSTPLPRGNYRKLQGSQAQHTCRREKPPFCTCNQQHIGKSFIILTRSEVQQSGTQSGTHNSTIWYPQLTW